MIVTNRPMGAIPNARPRRRRRRLLLLLPLLFGLALPSIVTTAVTVSLFQDTLTISDNAFSAGTIDLEASPSGSLLSARNMLPGDHVSASLTVRNRGTAPLLYSFTSSSRATAGAGLDGVLRLEIRSVGSSCETFDGAVLYEGPIRDAAFGSVLPGLQSGDRRLDGPASEVLCFRATLPQSAGNRYQQAASETSFTFDAELLP